MSNSIPNVGDLIPRPDPTKLTTEAVNAARREIENLFNAKLATVDQRISERDRLTIELLTASRERTEQSIAAAERAISKAEAATNTRFESVNEFRRALSDQTATFLGRLEYSSAHKALVDRVDVVTQRVAAMEAASQGRSSGLSSAGTVVMSLVTGLAVLVSIVSLMFNALKHG